MGDFLTFFAIPKNIYGISMEYTTVNDLDFTWGYKGRGCAEARADILPAGKVFVGLAFSDGVLEAVDQNDPAVAQ